LKEILQSKEDDDSKVSEIESLVQDIIKGDFYVGSPAIALDFQKSIPPSEQDVMLRTFVGAFSTTEKSERLKQAMCLDLSDAKKSAEQEREMMALTSMTMVDVTKLQKFVNLVDEDKSD